MMGGVCTGGVCRDGAAGLHIRTGIDLMHAARIQAAVRRRGDRLTARIWTAAERALCNARQGQARWLALAARFAAKEAVAKALGTGLLGSGGVRFTDIEICREAGGAPEVCLRGAALEAYRALAGHSIAVSLTHEGDLAMAVCTVLCAAGPPGSDFVDEAAPNDVQSAGRAARREAD